MYQKRLSYLCFLPKGKKRHFTPYNQGVRLLISLCRGRAKTYFVTGVDVSILETKFYNQMQSKQIFHFDSSGVPLYSTSGITKNLKLKIRPVPITIQKTPVLFNCFIANRLSHC
jgi:hypothetical protein